MKLVVSPTSYQNALDLISLGIDYILVGNNKFATRNSFDCSLDEIKKLITLKQNTKIMVQVNAWIFDKDLQDLEEYLIELSTLDIDTIVFSDYAIAEINLEKNLNLNLLYNSETTVTSAGQFEFFKDNQINGVFLARELFFNEIKMIAMNNKEQLKLMIQGHGLIFIMHSRWNLLSNFDAYLKDFNNERLMHQDFIYIRELLRKYPNILKQDDHGTHMFSGYELSTINLLKKLEEIKIDYLWINTYLHNDEYAYKISQLYLQALEHLKNNTYTQEFEDEAIKIFEQYAHNNIVTNNFLGNIKTILHMEKEEVDE